MTDAREIVNRLKEKEMKIVTAESVTGGLVSAALTAVPGASKVFIYGLVAYDNESKIRLLNLEPDIIRNNGAVSRECAVAMAIGALKQNGADIALSTTGFAGPGGGEDTAIGTVFIGLALSQRIEAFRHVLKGDRAQVRKQTVEAALEHLLEWIR